MPPVFHHHILQFLQSPSAAKSLRKFLTYPTHCPSQSHPLSYQFFIMNSEDLVYQKAGPSLKNRGGEKLISQTQNLPRRGVEG